MSIVIGVDIGTTSTKTIAFDELGHIIYQTSYDYPLITEETGQAEERPQDILRAVQLGLTEVQSKIEIVELKGIGFSSAMHTLILIDKNNHPLTNVYTWADNRATDTFKKDIIKDDLFDLTKNTGAPLHPMLPLGKLLWLKEKNKQLWDKTAFIVDIKSYILYQFSQHYYVDFATANASGLFNTYTKNWDDNILQYLNIKKEQLPQLVDTTFQVPNFAKSIKVPLVIGGSDGTLANLSNPQIDERFYTVSCGTSAAVRTNIDTLRLCQNRKLFTYYQYQNNWVVGAPTNNAGDVWQWLKDKIFNLATFEELNDLAEKSPVGAKGLFFVPYIFGERAPIWNPDASGGFMGLTAIHTNKDLARAVLEGELYNINLIIKELNQFNGQKPDALVLVGGMAKNQFFDQLLADITGYKVYVPESVEASALGAAILAMISLKIIASPLMIQKELKIAKIFHVNSHNHGIYVTLEKKWNKVRQLMTEEWLAVE